LYVEDAARGLLALGGWARPDPLNIGTGQEVSVAALAAAVVEAVGYTGPIRFDPSKPDGQPRKVMDITLATKTLGWEARTGLKAGLEQTVRWYREVLRC
jgi:GDP-L-fucose synthase